MQTHIWKHGEKPCFYEGCEEHDKETMSCKAYTTAKKLHKTVQATGKVWRCLWPYQRLHSLYVEHKSGCWHWRGPLSNGITPYYNPVKGEETAGVKAVYIDFCGKPKGILRRKCKNPLCVNPSHVVDC